MKTVPGYVAALVAAFCILNSALVFDAVAAGKAAAEPFSETMISDTVLSRMRGKSYPNGCIIPVEDLRYLQVLHYGFDGKVHQGEIIVNKRVARDVLSIFKELYEAKYPIEKMRLIDDYEAQDEVSMTDNNSSGFCFRNINKTNRISNHAKGLAIDINPLYNPFVKGTSVEPKAGSPYAFDRTSGNAYFIIENDVCVKTFAKYGFTWGGKYTSLKDYQHFEKNMADLYTETTNAKP